MLTIKFLLRTQHIELLTQCLGNKVVIAEMLKIERQILNRVSTTLKEINIFKSVSHSYFSLTEGLSCFTVFSLHLHNHNLREVCFQNLKIKKGNNIVAITLSKIVYLKFTSDFQTPYSPCT